MFALLSALCGFAVCAPALAQPAPGAAAQAGWTVVVIKTQKLSPSAKARSAAIARFGPFAVMDSGRAALIGVTDSASPAQFAAMLKAFPGIQVLEMVDCPGTYDDLANLRLGRMIRAAAIATAVPEGGSVRSGAVELFLSGATRSIAPGAEFAVHAWEDETGRTPADYAANGLENLRYLAYYQEMGMDAHQAKAFYAMTNSAPFARPLWLTGEDMAKWIAPAPKTPAPVLAYLDLGPALP